MNKFQQAYTADLEPITLEDVTFHVALPSSGNKRFQRAVLSKLVVSNDEGELVRSDVSIDVMVEYQIAAFVRTCIRKVDGWDDYTPEMLLDMPEACEELWEHVSTITNQKEAEANNAAKKSAPTSTGQATGQGEESSTPPLSAAAG